MATRIIPASAAPVTLTPAQLSAAREAFVARVDAAADRVLRGADMAGMPFRLIEASCFLAAAGVAAPACRGETTFAWDLSVSRQYLDGLDPNARQAEIDAGYAVLFEGTKRRPPICPDIARSRVALELVASNLEARWANNSARFFEVREAA